MKQLDHQRLDLLKLDIEGFEYDVIDDIITSAIRPRFILVEFHHSKYAIDKSRTMASVQKLRDYGYQIYWISDIGLEYGFVDQRKKAEVIC